MKRYSSLKDPAKEKKKSAEKTSVCAIKEPKGVLEEPQRGVAKIRKNGGKRTKNKRRGGFFRSRGKKVFVQKTRVG